MSDEATLTHGKLCAARRDENMKRMEDEEKPGRKRRLCCGRLKRMAS